MSLFAIFRYNVPFFLENMGPIFSEWTVNAHEARPGHHTQVNCGLYVQILIMGTLISSALWLPQFVNEVQFSLLSRFKVLLNTSRINAAE